MLIAALSLVVVGYSTNMMMHGKPVWWFGILAGMILLGVSASGWIRSLYREQILPKLSQLDR